MVGIHQTEKNLRSAYVWYLYVYHDTYHMPNESASRNRNRGDRKVPTRKRQDETNEVQIEIEKLKLGGEQIK